MTHYQNVNNAKKINGLVQILSMVLVCHLSVKVAPNVQVVQQAVVVQMG
jgi:hypothetical protein